MAMGYAVAGVAFGLLSLGTVSRSAFKRLVSVTVLMVVGAVAGVYAVGYRIALEVTTPSAVHDHLVAHPVYVPAPAPYDGLSPRDLAR